MKSIWFDQQAVYHCCKCQSELAISPNERDGSCEVCGTEFDLDDCGSYLDERVYLWWKYWLPGFALSVVSGIVSYAVCLQTGELGFALFVAVPLSAGAIVGYGTNVPTWIALLLAVICIPIIVCGLVATNFAGFFCGLTLGIIFLFPTLFGLLLGIVLKTILINAHWSQAWFFPLACILLLPYLVQAIERIVPDRTEIATVTTELTIDATPEEAWNAIMFYEEVEHAPPILLQLALPKPIRSIGDKQRVGEVVRCYYDRGVLVKRISQAEPNRKLSFDVIEQRLHFERDITLLDGGFQLTPVSPGSTRICLTTRYQRHLAPRWLWEPVETRVVKTLHQHVLEGMRRQVDAEFLREQSVPYVPNDQNLDELVSR